MEFSWPFAGSEALEDRWGQMARHWLRSGVVPDRPLGALRVTHDTVNGGMRVILEPGEGWVEGYYYVNDAALPLPIAAPEANPRIDAVVLRLDKTTAPPHRITAVVLSGTAAANPGLPVLTRGTAIWEETLAYVRVNPGAGGIVFANVRDARTFTRNPTSGHNLLYNPGFEVARFGANNDAFDGWGALVVNGTIAVAEIASTIGSHGRSARLTYGHNASLGGFADFKQIFNAAVGREYLQFRDRDLTFAVDVKSSVAQTVQLWISSGGTSGVTYSAFNVSTGEERLFVTHRADPGATEMQVVVRVGNASAVVELNNATLTLGAVPLPFTPLNHADDVRRARWVTPIGCRLRHSVGVSIPNATLYNLPFDTEDEDTDGMHDHTAFPANEAVTIRTPGRYEFIGEIEWAGGGTTGGMLSAQLSLNGSNTVFLGRARVINADSARAPIMQVAGARTLAAGDAVRLQAYQDSGGAKDVAAMRLTATRVA